MGTTRKLFFGTVALGGAALAGAAAYARANSMVSPAFIARYLVTPNSEAGRLFPYRVLRRAAQPRETPVNLKPIEQIVSWRGEHRGLTQVLHETRTNAFLVAHDGVITHSWVRDGFNMATPHSSWSVAKSVIGLVVGQLIAEKKLSEDTLLVDVLPEYRTGATFDKIRVKHLLDMESGIDLDESYTLLKPYTGVRGMLTSRDLPEYLFRNRRMYAAPGTVTEYRSVDTQYLSMMIARVENAPLTEVVQKRIWERIGAEDQAFWSLDDEGGIEKGYAMLNASARDFLKIGELILNDGRVGSDQVVPKSWVDRIKSPVGFPIHEARTWAYSTQWWHPEGYEEHGDLTALGIYGQYVYVNPAKRTVIVKLSDYGAEENEDETVEVFRTVASRL